MTFVEHTGNHCPVPPNTYVIYKTKNGTVPVSHIHMPMEAQKLNWLTKKINDLDKVPGIGLISHYQVVNRPKLRVDLKPLFSSIEFELIAGIKNRIKKANPKKL